MQKSHITYFRHLKDYLVFGKTCYTCIGVDIDLIAMAEVLDI